MTRQLHGHLRRYQPVYLRAAGLGHDLGDGKITAVDQAKGTAQRGLHGGSRPHAAAGMGVSEEVSAT